MRPCVICGKEFEPKRANGISCSPSCSAERKRQIEIERKRRFRREFAEVVSVREKAWRQDNAPRRSETRKRARDRDKARKRLLVASGLYTEQMRERDRLKDRERRLRQKQRDPDAYRARMREKNSRRRERLTVDQLENGRRLDRERYYRDLPASREKAIARYRKHRAEYLATLEAYPALVAELQAQIEELKKHMEV